MAAKDADLARDFSLDFVFINNDAVAAFEIELLATPPESAGPRIEELFLVEVTEAAFEIELSATPSGTGSADSFPVKQLLQKSQFISTEALDLLLPPFLDIGGGYIQAGSDSVTLTFKAPNGTIYNPTATWDTAVSMWVAQIPIAFFQEGEWLLYGVSDVASSLPQFAALWWGDYVDDIPETRQAALGRWKIEGTTLRLYEDDAVTVFLEFALKDDLGDPSNTRVFDKDPV